MSLDSDLCYIENWYLSVLFGRKILMTEKKSRFWNQASNMEIYKMKCSVKKTTTHWFSVYFLIWHEIGIIPERTIYSLSNSRSWKKYYIPIMQLVILSASVLLQFWYQAWLYIINFSKTRSPIIQKWTRLIGNLEAMQLFNF